MAAASYDQLLKQVEALKMENNSLRQELEDNSNHLSQLETEASNMKEVLKQLQGSIEEESLGSSGQNDLRERLKEINLEGSNYHGVKLRPRAPPHGLASCSRSRDGSPGSRRAVVRTGSEGPGCLEELEKERSLLMAELEKEEKEKERYYTQLQNLTKRIDGLPLTENTDMTRRQLEYEARKIRAAMEKQLGTCQDMEKRAQARVSRIQQVEKCMLHLRQFKSADVEKAAQSKNEPTASDCDGPIERRQASCDLGLITGGYAQASDVRMEPNAASDVSCSSSYSVPRRLTSHLGTKVEMVYSLLSMLGTHDKDDMSRTLLAMSSSQDSCIAMRQSGCLPLLIQLLHGNDKDSVLLGNSRGSKEARARASAALHNIVHSRPDDKRTRREIRVLHLLEQIRAYCETCWAWQEVHSQGMDQDKNPPPSPMEHQICPGVCVLMKLSFDEEHRHAMNELGGLQVIGELLQVDCEMYGLSGDNYSVTLRRYSGMALTNLTFGDVANKATLCSMKSCMRAMVAQLKSQSEDLQQVIASVLRNLSWRADANSKQTLRDVGSVKALTECALVVNKESTLKSVLSALWNLSAHCTENKADICDVEKALAFLVGTLTYRSQTNTLAIIESGGGILRNVSSLIATNEDYRHILRENNCLQTLLQHLKSHSLTIVSNACGTLWNLSARNVKDQEALWDMGAVSMLKNLIHSKHKMIAMGSAAALRNLMANRPAKFKDANIMSPGSSLPSLHFRKQKALIEELDAQQLSETFDNIDNLSPKASQRRKQRHKQNSDCGLDPACHNRDGACRSESFSPASMMAAPPFSLASFLPKDSRRASESPQAEMRGSGLDAFNPADKFSRRMQASLTPAQIAKVMEEVQSMTKGQSDQNAGATPDAHTSAMQAPSSVYKGSKPEIQGRTCPMPKIEYKVSSETLISVGSCGGYDGRGQIMPSVDSYLEDEEGKCCVYGKYPANLIHKIQTANHMEDNDGELDTPINYSLKYSDEQLNSGRQSPSHSERWARPRHNVGDKKPARSQSPDYPGLAQSNGDRKDKCMLYQPVFSQPESTADFRQWSSNSSEKNPGASGQGANKNISQPVCNVDDYEDDKPTNYSERYSEEEQCDEGQPMNCRMKFSEEDHHVEQPIDYSLKYSEMPSSQKIMFSHSNSSSQSSLKDRVNQGSRMSLTSFKDSCQKQLHPSSVQTGPNQIIQKTCKVSSINQETIQTYCVEDTPICFSRGSSLSSLSSTEDEMDEPEQSPNATSHYPTLPIADKGVTSELYPDQPVPENRSHSQFIRVKSHRIQGSGIGTSDGSRHKAGEFSSGAKSPSKSGAQTPKSPPEHYLQETPLMFSRCTSVSSLDSFESRSITSSVHSEPCSDMVSGIISPSDLPDSPGQTMPPSRSKTPPPPPIPSHSINQAKTALCNEKRDSSLKLAAVSSTVQRVQLLPDNDTLMHFAMESTPDGFSCSSSLSALSLDEPFIQKDNELKIMPPVHEDDSEVGNEGESVKDEAKETKNQDKTKVNEKDILVSSDDDDDDIEILEACINSAMPTKSSRKPKKPPPSTASRIPPPTARKPNQLPVYKLLPSQNRGQQQKQVSFTHGEDTARVFCDEGTPINFLTPTSLGNLMIESSPNDFLGIRSTEGREADQTPSVTDEKNEGDDILAECISSAMPKGKSHKPFSMNRIIDQVPHPSSLPANAVKLEADKKPTSPVKPMPQSREYRERVRGPSSTSGFAPEVRKSDPNTKSIEVTNKPLKSNERVRPSLNLDSPHHYTPIEGTPYCFSRNDSLSSLDFEDDDLDVLHKKSELGRKRSEQSKLSKNYHEKSSTHPVANRAPMFQRGPPKTSVLKSSKDGTGSVSDEKQNFAIEDTPVCFSRNSSLSSLSDIDQENNNQSPHQKENSTVKWEVSRPQAVGYAPKAFHVEDTPVCFSRNSSLSSLSIDSEDDLLQECISSAMPKKNKLARKNEDINEMNDDRSMVGILEETILPLGLADIHSPISERALSPDSESFDWKAIQEGANSVVSSLNQAAASLSRQGSSDTDSVLSLKSGISIVSPFNLTSDQEERPSASNKGPRIIKPGEYGTLESQKKEDQVKSIKGGKKVYKSLITGKPRTSLESVPSQQKLASVPGTPRGRTTTHRQGVRSRSPSRSPVPKKTPPKGAASKPFTQGQSFGKSPRNARATPKSDFTLSGQLGSQGGSSKASSRSSSRDSTPSRPVHQPVVRPMQSSSRTSLSPGRSGICSSARLSQLPRALSPSTSSTKSPIGGKMSCSPGRLSSQQTPTKQGGLPRSSSGIPKSESVLKGINQTGAGGPSKKLEQPKMSSSKSSGSESDRSEKPALVRQSTFIKETPDPALKRKMEESASFESLAPSSRPVSPGGSQSLSASSPSLRGGSPNGQGICWKKSPHIQRSTDTGDGRLAKRQDSPRSHSESPSRLPINRTGTWKRESGKHSSSLPRVNTWKRTGSSSSILSASSESSERAKSGDERLILSPVQGYKNGKGHTPLKGTWRKMREHEASNSDSSEPKGQMDDLKLSVNPKSPAVSKADVWVRIEDCPINSPWSGKSPTNITPPVIDRAPAINPDANKSNFKQSVVKDSPLAPMLGSVANLNLPGGENNEQKALEIKAAGFPSAATETGENPTTDRPPFSSLGHAKSSCLGSTVAARVTPFNYKPSSRKSGADGIATRPSQIPTLVTAVTKKDVSKEENVEPSENQSPKRLSGSYLVTSV